MPCLTYFNKISNKQNKLKFQGGDPQAAALILDFYTPAFKGRFEAWLSSIQTFAKPYDMRLGKISDILNVQDSSLFKVGIHLFVIGNVFLVPA